MSELRGFFLLFFIPQLILHRAFFGLCARMVEQVDTKDLKSFAALPRRTGSIPVPGIFSYLFLL